MSTRDIEAHLGEIYGVEVGRDLISRVTDAVMEDVRAWDLAAAGGRLPDRLFGLPGVEDPRERLRAMVGGLPGVGREPGG